MYPHDLASLQRLGMGMRMKVFSSMHFFHPLSTSFFPLIPFEYLQVVTASFHQAEP